MGSDVIAAAVAEADRRSARSDRDLSVDLRHYQRALPLVCARWRLQPVEWLDGGVNPPPLAVVTPAGVAGVLKVQPPGSLDAAARLLIEANGKGYVRVLDWDRGLGALLTERLGDTLWIAHADLAGQARAIVPLLRLAWQLPLSQGDASESKARGLLGILDELGARYGADAPAALELAAHYAERLAQTERAEVVCHGDPHAGNVLQRGDGWALIDPDGFVGERAYDLGVLLRDGCREIVEAESHRPGDGVRLLHTSCLLLAHLAGVEAERIWRWAFVERVTTGLYLHWFGHADQGRSFLTTAQVIARSSRSSR